MNCFSIFFKTEVLCKRLLIGIEPESQRCWTSGTVPSFGPMMVTNLLLHWLSWARLFSPRRIHHLLRMAFVSIKRLKICVYMSKAPSFGRHIQVPSRLTERHRSSLRRETSCVHKFPHGHGLADSVRLLLLLLLRQLAEYKHQSRSPGSGMGIKTQQSTNEARISDIDYISAPSKSEYQYLLFGSFSR